MVSELNSKNAHAHKHIIAGNWQIILLDSSIENTVHGEVDDEQLGFLERCLSDNPQHAIAQACRQWVHLFHPHPVPSWMSLGFCTVHPPCLDTLPTGRSITHREHGCW